MGLLCCTDIVDIAFLNKNTELPCLQLLTLDLPNLKILEICLGVVRKARPGSYLPGHPIEFS